MRVLQIHNYYRDFGGEDRAVDDESGLLRQRGDTVIQYSRHSSEINRFSLWKRILFFPSAFYSLKASREIAALVDGNKPDVAHIHNVFPLISPSVYFCLKRKRVPIVQTLHNFRFLCPNSLFYNKDNPCQKCKNGNSLHCLWNKCYRGSYILSALYAFVFSLHRGLRTFKNKISSFICLSNFAKIKFVESGFENSRIRVLGNFLSADSLPPEKTREDYAVYLGRLSEEKGIFTLLRAFKKVKKIRLKIIGKGGLEGNLRKFIEREEISNIEFTGFVEGDKKFRLLNKAKFSIMPSQCFENFPVAVLESFRAATPVIASRIGSLPELVEEGKSGLLFEPGDYEGLADKIDYMLGNPDKAEAMGEYAYGRVKAKHGPQMHYEGLIAIYKEAINANNR